MYTKEEVKDYIENLVDPSVEKSFLETGGLKYLDIDTELIIFPDEGHELSRSGRTDRRIARINHIIRWFDKYLKKKI